MRQYSVHKRFVGDVDRFMNRDENIDKMMTFVINYLSLRQVHSDEISNDEIMYVLRKTTFEDLDVPELYKELMDELTNQQFIFRIKRVKYIKNTQDSVSIVSSPLIEAIGNKLMMESISVDNKKVALIDPESDKQSEPEPKKEGDNSLQDPLPEDHSSDDSQNDADYILSIWNDPRKRLQWLLDNLSYTSKKYNYSHPSGYDVDELSKALGKDRKTILHYIRRYLVENASKLKEVNQDEIEKVKIE